MAKLLSGFLALLFSFAAYAQTAPADSSMPPLDAGTMIAVAGFLVLFFGTIVGYFVWVWWTRNKTEAQPSGE